HIDFEWVTRRSPFETVPTSMTNMAEGEVLGPTGNRGITSVTFGAEVTGSLASHILRAPGVSCASSPWSSKEDGYKGHVDQLQQPHENDAQCREWVATG